jgi:hypothetical protein
MCSINYCRLRIVLLTLLRLRGIDGFGVSADVACQ